MKIRDGQGDDDQRRFAEVDAESFAGHAADNMRWLAAAEPHAALRLACLEGDVVGGYLLLPVGQFFGGKPVPAQAVTAVAVHPAWRRRGVAGAFMRDCVAVAREQRRLRSRRCTRQRSGSTGAGVGKSALRRSGRRSGRLHSAGCPARGGCGANPDRGDIEAMRRAHLGQWDGPLDRPDWFLSVEWDPGGAETPRFEYGWYEGDRLTGYVRYESERQAGGWIRLRVQEFIWTTLDALRRLVRIPRRAGVAEQRGGVRALGARRRIAAAVAARRSRTVTSNSPDFLCWMQRIVDVDAAMTARGWPSRAAGRVELEVTDPVTGVERLVLEVESGSARVRRGGSGAVRCGIGALSAWYSSALRAQDAVRLGLLEGDASAVSAMDGLIAGGLPWMPDFF